MHFACICPPYHSHLRAMSALARSLMQRGHRITFAAHGPSDDLPGRIVQISADPTRFGGAISDSIRRTDALCRAAGQFGGIDAIVGDQTEPAAGLIAAHLSVPLISVACALPLERDPTIPLPFLGWQYDLSERGLARNRGGERVAGWVLHRQNRIIRAWSDRLRIPPFQRLEDCLSPILTISQSLPGFDYPRERTAIVETGLLRDGRVTKLGFVPSSDRPFVYASLGTLQGHRLGLLRTIAAGCRMAGVRVMISHGDGLSEQAASRIGADWTCAFAPQEAALERAALCISHAGLNTVMEALERKVPLIAIPLAFDQFGVAARIEWHGAGIRLSRHFLGAGQIARSIQRVIGDPSFGRNAARFEPGPGTALAVRAIEDRLINRQLTA